MAKQSQPEFKADLPATGYVRLTLLLKLIPFSRATIWRKVKNGEFPKPVKLSERVTAWPVESVRSWMAAQQQQGAA